jgi:hypothetical protein
MVSAAEAPNVVALAELSLKFAADSELRPYQVLWLQEIAVTQAESGNRGEAATTFAAAELIYLSLSKENNRTWSLARLAAARARAGFLDSVERTVLLFDDLEERAELLSNLLYRISPETAEALQAHMRDPGLLAMWQAQLAYFLWDPQNYSAERAEAIVAQLLATPLPCRARATSLAHLACALASRGHHAAALRTADAAQGAADLIEDPSQRTDELKRIADAREEALGFPAARLDAERSSTANLLAKRLASVAQRQWTSGHIAAAQDTLAAAERAAAQITDTEQRDRRLRKIAERRERPVEIQNQQGQTLPADDSVDPLLATGDGRNLSRQFVSWFDSYTSDDTVFGVVYRLAKLYPAQHRAMVEAIIHHQDAKRSA